MEFIGASLGASAGADFTTLSLSVLKKDVEKGFSLLADILLNPTFPRKEIKRRKELVKGALKQKSENPGYLASVKFSIVSLWEPAGSMIKSVPDWVVTAWTSAKLVKPK